MLPKDPVILLSYVNTKLRDNYSSLQEFCEEEGVEPVLLRPEDTADAAGEMGGWMR